MSGDENGENNTGNGDADNGDDIEAEIPDVATAPDDVKPVVNTVLAFICYGLNVGTTSNVKKIAMETFCMNEIKQAHTLLATLCNDVIDVTYRNRRKKDTCISDIVSWQQELVKIDKVPYFVVDVNGLALIPRFNIEDITEVALCDRMRRLESHIAMMDETLAQHTIQLSDVKLQSQTQSRQPPATKSRVESMPDTPLAGTSTESTHGTVSPSTDDDTGQEGQTCDKPNQTLPGNNCNDSETTTVSADVDGGISQTTTDTLVRTHPIANPAPPVLPGTSTLAAQPAPAAQAATGGLSSPAGQHTPASQPAPDAQTATGSQSSPVGQHIPAARLDPVVQPAPVTQPAPPARNDTAQTRPSGALSMRDALLKNKEQSWTTVTYGKKNGKKKKYVVNGKARNSIIKAAFRPQTHIYLGGIDNDVSCSDVIDYLTGAQIKIIHVKQVSSVSAPNKSFKITVCPKDFDKMFDDELWEEGTRLREWGATAPVWPSNK